MKKILASIFGIAAALLVFVGCPTSPESTASLTLDKNSLVITSALGGYTNQTLTATLENSTASLEWYTTNSKIVSVSAQGNSATLICEGTQGTARVGVITSDGELEAYCTVSVVLSETPAQALTDVTLVEGSQTVSGFTLNWNYPAISSAAVIDIFETQEAQDAANKLAASSSSQEPTVYKTYSVKRDVLSSSTSGTFTISNLLSNAEGKTYYYSAYGFLNGKRSTSYTNGTAKLIADSTAPGNVENIEASLTTDHVITLTWTEPSDEDYESVTVSISPATDFAGSALASDVATQTLRKGTTTATFSNLAAETEHTFTFKTADSNGNTQGDANNTENAGTSATFTTAKDETPPASVSGLSATFTVNGNVVVSWTDPEDVDFKQVIVSATTTTDGITAPESQTISAGTQTTIFSCDTSADYTFTVKTYDYNGNEGIAVSTEATKPTVTNVTAEKTASYSGVVVSWTEPSIASGYTFSYLISAYADESSDSKATATVASGTSNYTFSSELDFGTTYKFKISTVVKETSNESNTATYESSSTASSAMSKIMMTILAKDKAVYLTTNENSVITSSDTTKYQTKWLLRPALDSSSSIECTESNYSASRFKETVYTNGEKTTGTKKYSWGDTFSLEKLDTNEKSTGQYLYATSLSYTTNETDLTLSLTDNVSSISDKTLASFWFGAVLDVEGYSTFRFTKSETHDKYTGAHYHLEAKGTSGIGYRWTNGAPGMTQWDWLFTVISE